MTQITHIDSLLPNCRSLGVFEGDDWRELRRNGLGGSDAAVVMEESRFKTPAQLREEKRHGDTFEGNDATRFGQHMEDVIRQIHAPDALDGATLGTLQSFERPHMQANIDGLTRDGVLIEIKTAAKKSRRYWSGGPPAHYVAQVQHYLYVTGLNRAELYCAFVDADRATLVKLLDKHTVTPEALLDTCCKVVRYEIERDSAWLARYLPVADRFWRSVLEQTPCDEPNYII